MAGTDHASESERAPGNDAPRRATMPEQETGETATAAGAAPATAAAPAVGRSAGISLGARQWRARLLAEDLPGERGPQGPKSEKGELGLKRDWVYQTEFESFYNVAAHTWVTIATKQVEAIREVYTEAQKPTKPDLAEDLLISLAFAALGGAVNVIGTAIAVEIEKRAAAELGKRLVQNAEGLWFYQVGEKQWRMTYDMAKVKSLQDDTVRVAKLISEFGKDVFKDGIKNFVGPRIRGQLQAKKQPIDAFFEGLIRAATDMGDMRFSYAEAKRSYVLASAADPVSAAATEAAAMQAISASARDIQSEEVMKQWLLYQAQSRLGTFAPGTTVKGQPVVGTDFSRLPQGGGGYSHIITGTVPGLLYIDAYVDHDGILKPFERWQLPGLTRNMLQIIGEKPLGDLDIPFVCRITNKDGSPELPTYIAGEEHVFNIRRNENGVVTLSHLYPKHQAFLARYVGAKPVEKGGWFSSDKWDPSDVQRGAELIMEGFSHATIGTHVMPDKE